MTDAELDALCKRLREGVSEYKCGPINEWAADAIAALRRREAHITGLLQEQIDRAEQAEADSAALRAQVEALEKELEHERATIVYIGK